jgi:hypothetical protein
MKKAKAVKEKRYLQVASDCRDSIEVLSSLIECLASLDWQNGQTGMSEGEALRNLTQLRAVLRRAEAQSEEIGVEE